LNQISPQIALTDGFCSFFFRPLVDDPGGKKDEIKSSLDRTIANVILNRTNVDNFRATKDQQVTPATSTIISSSVTSTSTSNNTTNDSKYLHKKFKKFCATVDSNSHSREVPTATLNAASVRDGLLNNNSEIVENKNSWTPASGASELARSVNEETSLRNNHFVSVPSPPKHLLTTEEEKQLVKDIIDINNENFMHQSANQLNIQNTSSFLITPTASGSQFVTVTTLGNHNSNLQPADHRLKISSHQEVIGSFSQTPNGNFVIINNQASAEPSHQPTSTVSSAPATNSGSTPGRYICPYCQLNCAKPSVLQKHIRAHTNERPYPCTLCGFAFKTKSNLYKHCR
jgi:human immunodeficiency virus type I enhancer-binding protein